MTGKRREEAEERIGVSAANGEGEREEEEVGWAPRPIPPSCPVPPFPPGKTLGRNWRLVQGVGDSAWSGRGRSANGTWTESHSPPTQRFFRKYKLFRLFQLINCIIRAFFHTYSFVVMTD